MGDGKISFKALVVCGSADESASTSETCSTTDTDTTDTTDETSDTAVTSGGKSYSIGFLMVLMLIVSFYKWLIM